jgi:predicted transcriptional regulator
MSKKTGKLNKVEKFYIENNTDKNAAEIAQDLNRTEASVKKHIKSSKDTGHVSEVTPESNDVGNLMGHKEGRGVTVMTPAASELADDTRGSRVSSDRHNNAIHKIK